MPYDAGRFKDYFESQMTYGAGFRRNVSRYGSAVALIDPPTGREWTYAQLGADVERCAAMLAERGVRAGDRVMYQLFNGVEFALLYLAAHRLGAISVPVNYRLAPGETAHILRDSEPSVLIVDAECAA
ncbi:MAG: acsL, partial [Arthrobacter koreensis]